jgi:hypothetical protein
MCKINFLIPQLDDDLADFAFFSHPSGIVFAIPCAVPLATVYTGQVSR